LNIDTLKINEIFAGKHRNMNSQKLIIELRKEINLKKKIIFYISQERWNLNII
jgi:hypothetical protein